MSASAGSLPRYILQRMLLVIPMMWILVTLVFLLMRVAPGDPISAALGGKLDPAGARQRRAPGRPRQAADRRSTATTCGPSLQLNFGTTFTDNQPVIDVVVDERGATCR